MSVDHEVAIQLASEADVSAMAFMSRDLIEAGLPWKWTPDYVSRVLRHPSISTIVACDRGIVIAFASMYFADDVARLIRIAVEPPYRGMGIARQMFDWLRASCYTAGIYRIDSKHRLRNRTARTFLRQCGFRETALHPRYYAGVETAVAMTMQLPSLAVVDPADAARS